MIETVPIIQLGNPILRQKAAWVKNLADEHIQKLIDDLIAIGLTHWQKIWSMHSRSCDRY